MNKCEVCGKEVDYLAGGCAIMMAFYMGHTINLINNSFCSECYKSFIDSPMRELSNILNIKFDEDYSDERCCENDE